jgi:TPR repeat protein
MKWLATVLSVLLVVAVGEARAGFDEGVVAYHLGDYATAMRELRPLAEQGDARAQVFLGRMYEKGHGAPQDYAEAAKWFRKAAEQGDAEAQIILGRKYGSDQGVPQDYVQAHMWLNVAAAAGSEIAKKNRETVAKEMTPSQIAEAQWLAREWTEKHQK